MPENLYHVLLPLPFDHTFTYLYDGPLFIGQIVQVPFGNRTLYGVIWDTDKTMPVAKTKLKSISAVVDYQINDSNLQFIKQVSAYNLIPLGITLKMMLGASNTFQPSKPRKVKEEKLSPANTAQLSQTQQKALEILHVNMAKQFAVSVLHGVTGSGKTEVYLKLVEETLNANKQVLILLPEIILTRQLIGRFSERLGIDPTEWHSGLTPANRRKNWHNITSGKVNFIVGARSALFLPYNNLGLIIVDEEHDSSFKQEEGAIYNARDMAILKAKLENIPVILSSATPSIETEYNIKNKKYDYVFLPVRHGDSILPQMSVVDLSKQPKTRKSTWISQPLREELIKYHAQNRQSMIFLNRRGYAPVTLCGNCFHKIECPHCNFNLVEHKARKIMQCHYCGYQQGLDIKCKNCESCEKFHSVGPGVERIAEEITSFLPQAKVAILSSDTMNSHKKVDQMLIDIAEHKIDILVGTQMITKGLHFPKLDLVGVLDSDAALLSGDIRAMERTYQILHQVSGRAGRESIKGKVILQTLNPDSVLIQNLINGDWNNFIELELSNRKVANMPPYTRLALITLSGRNDTQVYNHTSSLSKIRPQVKDVTILGPSPAPLFLLKGQYRYRFVIIANKQVNVQKLIKTWLSMIGHSQSIKIKVDIDPISFS